ncbi:hypothetical protein [Nocardia xishanensis]|uniref:hypothetical protein n=1 Tax=Nocardia xishanensis TaxID=238964 RepID=UPI000837238A|nr:hypothetical protein [Nocardia xishanensis]
MNAYAEVRSLIAADRAGTAVRGWARDYLADLLEGRTAVAAVRHPLGFACFPVWRGDTLGVCLHVWSPDARPHPTTSTMHAHSWDLVSSVLYGTVINEIVEATADARPTHRIFEVHSGAGGDLVRATPRLAGYRVRSREFFREGDVYTLRHGVFHVSDVPGAAATLVLGEYRPGEPDLSLGALGGEDHWVHRVTCTEAETGALARAVLDRLTDQSLPEDLEERCDPATP